MTYEFHDPANNSISRLIDFFSLNPATGFGDYYYEAGE